MHIQNLQIENYGPFYGKHEFNLANRGLVLITGENLDEPRMNSNGSGKSSLFDALDWCLFSDIPRKDHVDSICNDENPDTKVSVTIQTEQQHTLKIERTRRAKKSGLSFWVNGTDKTTVDLKETQKEIIRHLGVDRDIFHSAVLFGQFDLVRYADSSDTERMRTLTSILQLDDIDLFLAKAKEERKALEIKYDLLSAELYAKGSIIENMGEKDFSVSIANWDNQQQQRINQLEQSRQALFSSLQEQGMSLDEGALKAELARLAGEREQASIPIDDTEKRKISSLCDKMREEIAILFSREESHHAAINKFTNLGFGKCSNCGQQITKEHLEKEISDLSAQLLVIQEGLASKRAGLDKLEEAYLQWDKHIQERRQQQSILLQTIAASEQKIQSELSLVTARKQEIARKQQELANLEQMLNVARSEVNPFLQQVSEHEEQLNKLRLEKQQCDYDLTCVNHQMHLATFWVDGFGPKGLKSYILDSKLAELNEAVNEWVQLLTGGTIWVKFEAQKATRSNKVVNAPDVRVFRSNPDGTITERNYKSWSGGEKQRISFAIDFGLSRLIARRAGNTYDLLILDEVFRHLDDRGKEAVIELLKYLAREKSSVFVVEHDSGFQNAFDQRIVVQKKNKRSNILEN